MPSWLCSPPTLQHQPQTRTRVHRLKHRPPPRARGRCAARSVPAVMSCNTRPHSRSSVARRHEPFRANHLDVSRTGLPWRARCDLPLVPRARLGVQYPSVARRHPSRRVWRRALIPKGDATPTGLVQLRIMRRLSPASSTRTRLAGRALRCGRVGYHRAARILNRWAAK